VARRREKLNQMWPDANTRWWHVHDGQTRCNSTDVGMHECARCHGNSCSWYFAVWIIFVVNYQVMLHDNSIKWHWYWLMFIKVIGHDMRARFFGTQCRHVMTSSTLHSSKLIRLFNGTFLLAKKCTFLFFHYSSANWRYIMTKQQTASKCPFHTSHTAIIQPN